MPSQAHNDEHSIGYNSIVCCGAIVPSSSSLYNSRVCGNGTLVTSSTLRDSVACCGAVIRSSTAMGSRLCGSSHDSDGHHIGDATDICEISSSTIQNSKVGLGLVASSTVTSCHLGECTIKSSTMTSCVMHDIYRTSKSDREDRSGKGKFDFQPHYVPNRKSHHDDPDDCLVQPADVHDEAPPSYSLVTSEKSPLLADATDTVPSRCCVIA